MSFQIRFRSNKNVDLQGYDASESAVRKASCFCLVALHLAIGEDLNDYLSDLNGSKVSVADALFVISTAEGEACGASDEAAGCSASTSITAEE